MRSRTAKNFAPARSRPTPRLVADQKHRGGVAAILAILAVVTLATASAFAEPQLEYGSEAVEPGTESASPLGSDEIYMRHPLLTDPGEDDPFDPDAGGAPSLPMAATEPLEIAAWDLRSAVTAGLLVDYKIVEKTWRHTFGSQMQAYDRASLDAADLTADFVMLQNVASVSEVRQLFPAREWNVVFSRAMLEMERDGQPQRRGDLAAIAYRYRRGLRITATEEFARPDGDTTTAGLAVRFSNFGDEFWLVSANLPRNCPLVDGGCAVAVELTQWRDRLDDGGVRKITGGIIGHEPATSTVAQPSPTPTPVTAEKPRPSTGDNGWLFGWFSSREKIAASTAPPPAEPAIAHTPQATPPEPPTCARVEISIDHAQANSAAHVPKLGCLARLTLNPVARPTAAAPLP